MLLDIRCDVSVRLLSTRFEQRENQGHPNGVVLRKKHGIMAINS